MSSRFLAIDPSEVASAAADLDRIAQRLTDALGMARPVTAVTAPARDEVSVGTAAAASELGTQFGVDAASGIHELRKIAAVLRAAASGMDAADDANAAGFR
ncbi:PE family protein [Gordonia sp. VNK1]|uniref:PE family protein n=1 Tax=Gordonia oleivorans TaxID=3156618 RepID=UPI0032B5E806